VTPYQNTVYEDKYIIHPSPLVNDDHIEVTDIRRAMVGDFGIRQLGDAAYPIPRVDASLRLEELVGTIEPPQR